MHNNSLGADTLEWNTEPGVGWGETARTNIQPHRNIRTVRGIQAEHRETGQGCRPGLRVDHAPEPDHRPCAHMVVVGTH